MGALCMLKEEWAVGSFTRVHVQTGRSYAEKPYAVHLNQTDLAG